MCDWKEFLLGPNEQIIALEGMVYTQKQPNLKVGFTILTVPN